VLQFDTHNPALALLCHKTLSLHQVSRCLKCNREFCTVRYHITPIRISQLDAKVATLEQEKDHLNALLENGLRAESSGASSELSEQLTELQSKLAAVVAQYEWWLNQKRHSAKNDAFW
jgi:hypothetical protein